MRIQQQLIVTGTLLQTTVSAATAWALGVHPVGGAILGATSLLGGRIIISLLTQVIGPVTPDSSIGFDISNNTSKVAFAFLTTCALLHFSAQAVGYAITFKAVILIIGTGFLSAICGMAVILAANPRYISVRADSILGRLA